MKSTKKRGRTLSRCVKDLDIFGYPVHLGFEGKTGAASGTFIAEPMHQTLLGASCSLIFIMAAMLILAAALLAPGGSIILGSSFEVLMPDGAFAAGGEVGEVSLKDQKIAVVVRLVDMSSGEPVEVPYDASAKKYIKIEFV